PGCAAIGAEHAANIGEAAEQRVARKPGKRPARRILRSGAGVEICFERRVPHCVLRAGPVVRLLPGGSAVRRAMNEPEVGNDDAIEIALANDEAHGALAEAPLFPVTRAWIIARPTGRDIRIAGALHHLRPGRAAIDGLEDNGLAKAVR